jgi:hypothetical protein
MDPFKRHGIGHLSASSLTAQYLMRRVRDVLRLMTAGVGLNEIARRVGG